MLNLPNFVTLIRIVAIPFFLVLLSAGLYLDALIVFIVSGLTDFLAGALARMEAIAAREPQNQGDAPLAGGARCEPGYHYSVGLRGILFPR